MSAEVAFTGSRTDCPPAQEAGLEGVFRRLGQRRLSQGCCVGRDEAATRVAHLLGWHVEGYPAFAEGHPMRSDLACKLSSVLHDPIHPPMLRNRTMIDATTRLIAAPEGPETLRSGTWATIRYARELKRPIIKVWPDGSWDIERAT